MSGNGVVYYHTRAGESAQRPYSNTESWRKWYQAYVAALKDKEPK